MSYLGIRRREEKSKREMSTFCKAGKRRYALPLSSLNSRSVVFCTILHRVTFVHSFSNLEWKQKCVLFARLAVRGDTHSPCEWSAFSESYLHVKR